MKPTLTKWKITALRLTGTLHSLLKFNIPLYWVSTSITQTATLFASSLYSSLNKLAFHIYRLRYSELVFWPWLNLSNKILKKLLEIEKMKKLLSHLLVYGYCSRLVMVLLQVYSVVGSTNYRIWTSREFWHQVSITLWTDLSKRCPD